MKLVLVVSEIMSLSLILLICILGTLCGVMGIILLGYLMYHSQRACQKGFGMVLQTDYENYHLLKRLKRFEYEIREDTEQ